MFRLALHQLAPIAVLALAGPGDPLDLSPLTSLDGQPIPGPKTEHELTVLVYLWSECPISNQYAPALNQLAATWNDQPVRLIGVFVDPDKPGAELIRHAHEYTLSFPLARDPNGELARRLGVDKVPMAQVFDQRGKLRYRGRIDDRFAALGRKRPGEPTPDLGRAVADLQNGRPVAVPETNVVGCTNPGSIDQVAPPSAHPRP